jgi:amino acid adenylation domain-containing protein
MSNDVDRITELSAEQIKALAQRLKRRKIGRGEMGMELGLADRTGKLPLSFAQQRLWFTDQLEGGSVAYNVPLAVRLNGELNVPALREAVTEIVRRHEVLRTCFPCHNGEPEQQIGGGEKIKLEAVDLGGLPVTARYAIARRLAEDEPGRGFNLATGPLVRVMLVSSSHRENVLVVVMHHIVSDGWSTGILIKELSVLYQAFLAGGDSPLKPLKFQYADYAVWQRNWLNGDVVEQEMSYWRKQLHGLERLEIAPDGKRSGNRAAVVRLEIGKPLSVRLRQINAREELTMFMFLTAAFQLLLSRLTGLTDIAIGTDVANRNRVELEGLVGFFINQLVLRTRVEPDLMVGQFLAQVRQVVIGAYAHQNVPFEKVVEEIGPDRAGGSPLFSAKLIMQNAPAEDLAMGTVNIESFNDLLPPGAKLDLHVAVEEGEEGVAFVFTYPEGLFQTQRINRLATQFTRTLEFLADHPEKQIRDLNFADDAERDRVLLFGQGCSKLVTETVVELFQRQAAERPDLVAVVSNGQSYTFDQLTRHSNQLARFLLRMGAQPETRVGICLSRCADFVLAVLAIWKAGAAYVAVDAEDPEDRKAALLDDAGVAIVLTNSLLKPGLSLQWATVVSLDEQAADISSEEPGPLAFSPIPQSLAYVMYTSGSSGKPKGVAIEHRQIANYVTAIVERLELVPEMSFALVSTLAADLGHTVLFPALATGGSLHLIDEWVARDGNLMRDYILTHRIHCIKMTASHLRLWMSSGLFSLPTRKLVLGGEALGKQWVDQVRNLAQQCEIWNHYGPTETTVGVTAGRVRYTQRLAVPLGSPLANTQLYVLDQAGALCGIGVPGELYIGGAGVARGYINRPGHTAERFVPDALSGVSGARLYRSGDLARWSDDGELEFLGRKDHQVKVRGYRIELAEIETVMMRQAGVNQCVLSVRETREGSQMLVAYVTGDAPEDQLRKDLSTELPAYMVPGRIVKVDQIPLTANGKLDRKALEQLSELQQEREERFLAPRSEIEELLCGIWADLLDRERVGIRENFFDLGGHSLIATQVVSRIRALFGVEVPLRAMFDSPTVEALAVEVDLEITAGRRQSAPQLVPVVRTGRLPLSFAQQRLWFIDQLEPGNPVYNCPRLVRLEGNLKVWALRDALSEIVRRHEVLRTSFPAQGGDPEQKIHVPHDMDLPVLDLALFAEHWAEQVARELAEKEALCSFDLATGPMFRATLVKITKREHLLVLVMHHIVSDGWSAGVLIKELTALYQAFSDALKSPLDDLPLQYADYAIWQRNWLNGEVLEQQLDYWRNQLHGIDRLELPTDRPRTPLASNRAQVISFQFAQPLAQKLRDLCRTEGVTLFMTLVAAFQLLLSRYTGQTDVAIGTVVANRNQLQIENLLGFFINQLVLRTQLDLSWSVRLFLQHVRDIVLAAYAHQDLPFEKLVEELAVQRDLSRAPFFDYAIELQTLREGRPWQTGDIRFSSIDLDITTTKLDLDLLLYDDQCCIIGYAYYNSDLFSAETISRLVSGFQPVLEQFACNVGAELRDIWPGDESKRYEELLSTSLEMLEV